MNQKRNQGYQRTHESIRNCFYELLQEKPLNQITVGEICKAVDINRSTFYAHFQDLYEVLELIFNELNEEMLGLYQAKSEADKAAGKEEVAWNMQDYTILQLEHMQKYSWFYLILLRDPSNLVMASAMKSLRENIADPIFAHFGVTDWQSSYFFHYTVAGYFAVIQQWLEGGCRETPEQIALIIDKMQPAMPEDVFNVL